MSKIKNGGLHQYGAERFEEQKFGTDGVERVKVRPIIIVVIQAILSKLTRFVVYEIGVEIYRCQSSLAFL